MTSLSKSNVETIPLIHSKLTNNNIVPSCEFSKLYDLVHKEGGVVLKGIFRPDYLLNIKNAIFDFFSNTDTQLASDNTFHRIDHLPPKSITPHIFHAFTFNLGEKPGGLNRIEEKLFPFFTILAEFQNKLTGNNATFNLDNSGRKLRPQIIQYPSGGGFFEDHTHPYLPQKIGLIVNLAERGKDFKSGETYIKVGELIKCLSADAALGDICLFRYDLPHWVSKVDPDCSLDWNSVKGRWTAVLPYN